MKKSTKIIFGFLGLTALLSVLGGVLKSLGKDLSIKWENGDAARN